MTDYLTVGGGTLAYETTGGSGQLVLLAHGIGDSRRRGAGDRHPGGRPEAVAVAVVGQLRGISLQLLLDLSFGAGS